MCRRPWACEVSIGGHSLSHLQHWNLFTRSVNIYLEYIVYWALSEWEGTCLVLSRLYMLNNYLCVNEIGFPAHTGVPKAHMERLTNRCNEQGILKRDWRGMSKKERCVSNVAVHTSPFTRSLCQGFKHLVLVSGDQLRPKKYFLWPKRAHFCSSPARWLLPIASIGIFFFNIFT